MPEEDRYLGIRADIRALQMIVDRLVVERCVSSREPLAALAELEAGLAKDVKGWSIPGAPEDVLERSRERLRTSLETRLESLGRTLGTKRVSEGPDSATHVP